MFNKESKDKIWKWYDLYCMFDSQIEDKRFLNIPINLKYKMYSNYMKQSIGYFEEYCYKDISDYNDFKQEEKYFRYNNEDNQLYIELQEEYENIYIGYRFNDESYTEIKCYNYDKFSNVLEIQEEIDLNGEQDCELYVVFYNIGNFLEENKLNLKECNILVLGMLCVYDNSMRQRQSLLEQRVYNKSSTGMYSQANHIEVLNNLYDSIYFKQLEPIMKQYTMEESKDKLWMLAGRQSAYELGEL